MLDKELLEDNIREALKKLALSLSKASTEYIILLYVHFIIFTLCYNYIFTYRSLMETSCNMDPLT
jgi:hypothetical protein